MARFGFCMRYILQYEKIQEISPGDFNSSFFYAEKLLFGVYIRLHSLQGQIQTPQ